MANVTPVTSLRFAATVLALCSLLPFARPASAVPTGARPLSGGRLIEGRCPAAHPRCIAFTFDDGPDAFSTPRLLDLLDRHHVRATFFVVGHRIDGDEPHHRVQRGLLREIVRRGHLIGNHTYHHVVLGNLRPQQIDEEIDRTDALIAHATGGRRTGLFRAPFGMLSAPRSLQAVDARRLTPAYWMIDTHDWEARTSEQVVTRFRQELLAHPNGGVVLMHDTRPWSVSAFPMIMGVIARRNADLVAHGQAPYEVLNLDAFVVPRGTEPLRGEPGQRRQRSGAAHAATR